MAYVKLDTGILDSTLWMDRESREVFITALLMASPHEVADPTPQIDVRTLEQKDGFVVPPGWYGRVDAAGVGILRRAGVVGEPGMAALERLGEPDPESRTPLHDGRRLVRVHGGFLILNYMQYRDRDHTAAERQRRLRERKKSRSHGVTSRNIPSPSRIADADADAVDQKNIPSNEGIGHHSGDDRCPVAKIVELFHEILPKLPRTEKITKARRGFIQQRWREDIKTLEQWRNYFTYVGHSNFLMGRSKPREGQPPFIATLEWITRPTNYTKILEGKYHHD